jgi:hypothetical protein
MNYIFEVVKKESPHPDNFYLFSVIGLPLNGGRSKLPGQIRDSRILIFLPSSRKIPQKTKNPRRLIEVDTGIRLLTDYMPERFRITFSLSGNCKGNKKAHVLMVVGKWK